MIEASNGGFFLPEGRRFLLQNTQHILANAKANRHI
jgi:hypothetical protein